MIIDNLPFFIQGQQILQIANMVALILITISLAGGLAVIAGGILILANRVGIGRLLIGLGAGIGIPRLIMLAITLITTGQVASLLVEYSSTRWVGAYTRLHCWSDRKVAELIDATSPRERAQ